MIGNSEELKLARELHMVMNTSISNWYVARFGKNPPGGDTLAWTVVIAMAMELVVLQQSKQWPMHKIVQAVKDLVANPDMITYVRRLLSAQNPSGGTLKP